MYSVVAVGLCCISSFDPPMAERNLGHPLWMPQRAAVLQAAQSIAIQLENPAVLVPEPTVLLWLAAAAFFSWTVLRDTPDSPAIHNPLS